MLHSHCFICAHFAWLFCKLRCEATCWQIIKVLACVAHWHLSYADFHPFIYFLVKQKNFWNVDLYLVSSILNFEKGMRFWRTFLSMQCCLQSRLWNKCFFYAVLKCLLVADFHSIVNYISPFTFLCIVHVMYCTRLFFNGWSYDMGITVMLCYRPHFCINPLPFLFEIIMCVSVHFYSVIPYAFVDHFTVLFYLFNFLFIYYYFFWESASVK